jgi:hypothetical protein
VSVRRIEKRAIRIGPEVCAIIRDDVGERFRRRSIGCLVDSKRPLPTMRFGAWKVQRSDQTAISRTAKL